VHKYLFALLLCLSFSAQAENTSALFAATLHDIHDKPVALEKYKGKPLIVNFWARWCAPCREEIPEFVHLQTVYRNKVEILGIGLEDDAAAVRQFAGKYKINYPLFLARDQGIPLMKALENTRGGLPFTVVINRQGKIVHTKLGLMRKDDLEKAVALALQ
jgi:thiol-disulfide isomerase/thioredoxin